MSKIFEESSMLEAIRTYLKQCAALATVWLNKYRDDPFFRTEVNVVSLQIGFALLVVSLVGASFSLLDRNISTAINQGIQSGLTDRSPAALASANLIAAVVNETQQIRTQNLSSLMLIILFLTILFAYFVARITLRPARAALGAQKQFIGNVAHELRTPLAVIKTNTEVALLDAQVPQDLREALESNVEELDRISEIINNLLSLSTLVRPEQMGFSEVDMRELMSEVVDKYTELAKKNNVQIVMRINSKISAWGNKTALTQVIANVLKNAINYTSAHGQVTISSNTGIGRTVEIIIRDSGIGIARSDLSRIFEPFYRADPSRVRGKGGSGLGLAIVSELVKMHNGKITIRSAVGKGTTVTIRLPGPQKDISPSTAKKPSKAEMDFSGTR